MIGFEKFQYNFKYSNTQKTYIPVWLFCAMSLWTGVSESKSTSNSKWACFRFGYFGFPGNPWFFGLFLLRLGLKSGYFGSGYFGSFGPFWIIFGGNSGPPSPATSVNPSVSSPSLGLSNAEN